MVSALAGAKSVEHVGLPGHPILVVDIGTQWTDICLVDGGRVTSCRSVRLGSDDLTDAYVHDFKVDRDEAERLRQTHGIALNARNAAVESGAEISSVEVWADRIAEEMRRTTLSTGNGSNGSRPHKAVIIGGITELPSLTEGLSRRSGLTVEIGDPWNAMKLSEVCEHILREMPASFAVATGLAMSGLDGKSVANMMPQYVAEEKLRKRKEVAVFSGMSALAAILMIVYLVGGSTVGSKKAELRRLDAQVDTIKRDMRKAGPSIRPSAQVGKTTVTSVESKDYGAIELLRLLSIHLPRSLWLNEFSYEGGKSLVLKGQALSNSAIADAIDILTQLEKFESVTMDYSNLARGEGSQGYDFQITCTLPESKNGSAKSKTGSGKRSGAGLETGIVVQ
jgi:cell division ATPase FtsA